MIVWVAALLLAAGCGRVAFDPLSSRGDAGDAPGGGDAPADAPADAPCTWSAFSPPVQLPAIVQSTSDDWSPGPALRGSIVYFHSFRASGNSVLFHAQLAPTAQTAIHATELDLGTQNLANPSLTDDGLEIYFDADGGGVRTIYSASRTDTALAFGAPAQVPSLDLATFDNQNPTISGDGLRIIFESSRAGLTTLWEAARPDRTSAFGTPVRRTELEVASNTGRLDRGGTLTPDGLDIYFAAPPGGVGQDIFTAHRATVGVAFGTPVRVAELSSAMEDEYPKMSRDASTLWLTYQGNNAGGADAQLWVATRVCQ